jgi:hypothetical protein
MAQQAERGETAGGGEEIGSCKQPAKEGVAAVGARRGQAAVGCLGLPNLVAGRMQVRYEFTAAGPGPAAGES